MCERWFYKIILTLILREFYLGSREIHLYMVEKIETQTNDTQVVLGFLKQNILLHFRVPRTLVSDKGTYFLNPNDERSFDEV